MTDFKNGIPPDAAQESGWFKVRTRSVPILYERVLSACVVDTLEGPIDASAGDVVLTGIKGERWPVSETHFLSNYAVIDGKSAKKKAGVDRHAKRVTADCVVSDASSGKRFNAKAGDYQVRDAAGSTWVVEADIFRDTYESIDA